MIRKISRKAFLTEYPAFPVVNYYRNTSFYPETFGNYILCVEARSAIGLGKHISTELSKLLKLLSFDEMLFLGDTTTPWLFREHHYKPVAEALSYLSQHKLSKSFNGALRVTQQDVQEFLSHLFWLVRCNGVMFTPHFADKNFYITVNICQYGNIHFSTLNKNIDDAFKQAIISTKLLFFEGEKCVGYKIPYRMPFL